MFISTILLYFPTLFSDGIFTIVSANIHSQLSELEETRCFPIRWRWTEAAHKSMAVAFLLLTSTPPRGKYPGEMRVRSKVMAQTERMLTAISLPLCFFILATTTCPTKNLFRKVVQIDCIANCTFTGEYALNADPCSPKFCSQIKSTKRQIDTILKSSDYTAF